MTVHMIRIFCEWPDNTKVSDINDEVDKWINNHTEWTGDYVEHKVNGVSDNPDVNVDYLVGDFRFESSDDKTKLLDNAEAELQDHVSWYRLGYHACDHDESEPTGCSWDDQREYGTVPDGITTFV